MRRSKIPPAASKSEPRVDPVALPLARAARSFLDHRHFFIALSIHDVRAVGKDLRITARLAD